MPRVPHYRVSGDAWRWRWTTDADVSGWSSPVIQIRNGAAKSDLLIASNVVVGDRPADLFTDGNEDWDLPETDFGEGVFAFYVLPETTVGVVSQPYLEIEVLKNGAPSTAMPATPFPWKPELAVRP